MLKLCQLMVAALLVWLTTNTPVPPLVMAAAPLVTTPSTGKAKTAEPRLASTAMAMTRRLNIEVLRRDMMRRDGQKNLAAWSQTLQVASGAEVATSSPTFTAQ